MRAGLPEILTALGAHKLQLVGQVADVLFQMRMLERRPQVNIRLLVERVKVATKGARKQHRFLTTNPTKITCT